MNQVQTRRSPEELLEHITSESSDFREVLSMTSPEAPVPACPDWTAADLLWHFDQAHEALIHRLDAEETAGQVTPLDPALAADGVAELLEVMYGGVPSWGTFTPSGATVRVDITDNGDELLVDLGRFTGTSPTSGSVYDVPALEVVNGPPAAQPAPAATVAAPAAVLDTWLWRRGDVVALLGQVELTGDAEALDRFRAVVSSPVE